MLDVNSASVQSYLTILQDVISRMAKNSTNAKGWCIALVSAIVVVIADKGRPEYVWISMFPIALFLYLDAYYLGLERLFRGRYNEFVHKLHGRGVTVEDIVIVTPGNGLRMLASAALATLSLSVWPFYALLVTMLLLVRRLVL